MRFVGTFVVVSLVVVGLVVVSRSVVKRSCVRVLRLIVLVIGCHGVCSGTGLIPQLSEVGKYSCSKDSSES